MRNFCSVSLRSALSAIKECWNQSIRSLAPVLVTSVLNCLISGADWQTRVLQFLHQFSKHQ